MERHGGRSLRRVGEARKSLVDGALREPVQNSDTCSQGFNSVRNPPFLRRFAPHTLLLALLAGLVAQSGCGPAGGSPTKITNRRADSSSQWSDDLFSFALENLNHLEDNDCEEMLRSTQQRMAALQQPELAPGTAPARRLARQLAGTGHAPPGRQPLEPVGRYPGEACRVEARPHAGDACLPIFVKLPMVENIGQAHFTAYDGYMLMEAVWLRDASRSKWAGGGTADELHVARSLFDWTVRNIQTDDDRPGRVPQVPWETLFLGHGTSLERAWTYILLLRQRGIDAALLALPGEDSSSATKPGTESLQAVVCRPS